MTDANPLPSHASVVVIGGGVLGCSTLYHLAKLGAGDALLLERNQLTSGTTWHSAAQVRQLRSTRNLTRLIQYSTRLYARIEEETGQHSGWNRTGSLSIATSVDRWIHIRRQAAVAKAYGVEAYEIGHDEVRALWPLMNADDVVGAVYSPDDGRVNPSDLCLALVMGAKARGARVLEDTAVTEILRDNGRITGVRTAFGDVTTEKLVICGGLWSRALAAGIGVPAPLLPCEHYYLLTKPIEGIEGHLPTLSDHDAHLYIRDDVGGLLVGCFEPQAIAVDPASLGENFAFSLLNGDWDHFEPMMLNALHRIPALETAQVRTLLNGPESFTPDGSFLMGEAAELRGLYLGCGMNSVGVASGGGAGWALAHCVIEGALPFDLGETDPRRFHELENTLTGLTARAPEVLGRHYEIAYPGRVWTSARDLRPTPLHARWVEARARFTQVYGWERPQYFDSGTEPVLTFGRPAWFDQVAAEVAAAHGHAAIFDLSTFGKIRVTGADAERFLDRVCANDLSRAPGHVIYTAMLDAGGGFQSDLTALRLGEDEYLLYVGTAAVKRDLAWLRRSLNAGERVELVDVTERYAVLGLAGPRVAGMIAASGAGDLGALPYFQHADAEVAGVAVRAARVSYVGEAGWELTCAAGDATRLYDALAVAGARPAGLFAQSSMRIEKRHLAMGHDLDSDVTPIEAGLDFAVSKRGGFVGYEALAKRRAAGPARRMMSIVLEDPDAYPLGDEPVYVGDVLAGQATSAAFGHRIGKPVALAYLASEHRGDAHNTRVELDIAGERFAGLASTQAAFDPKGLRMRH